MNGAQALIRTLVEPRGRHLLHEPGHLGDALRRRPGQVTGMHSVLALFEGVATGAADGYARMAGRPAATLLHLGPGLGNGLANLHNARRAHSPVVNIVGDHAIVHRPYDAQLQSDIETVARNVSTFVHACESTDRVADDAVAALDRRRRSARLGGHAHPSRRRVVVGWWFGGKPVPDKGRTRAEPGGDCADEGDVECRRRRPCAPGEPSRHPHRRTGMSGAGARRGGRHRRRHRGQAACRDVPGTARAGAGRPAVERLAYLAEFTALQLEGARHLILRRRRVPGVVLRLPRKAKRPGPRGCTVQPWPVRQTTSALPWLGWPRCSASGQRQRPSSAG